MKRLSLLSLVLLMPAMHVLAGSISYHAATASPFMQRIYQAPIPTNKGEFITVVKVFELTGRELVASRVRDADERRLLKKFLKEPFKEAPTLDEAVILEPKQAESIDALRKRARALVKLRRDDRATGEEAGPVNPPVARGRYHGYGIWWTRTSDRMDYIVMRVQVANNSTAAIVGEFYIEAVGRDWSAQFTCNTGEDLIRPKRTKYVMCDNRYRFFTSSAVADLKQPTLDADLHILNVPMGEDQGSTPEPSTLPYDRARRMLEAASCNDLGTCEQVAQLKENAKREERQRVERNAYLDRVEARRKSTNSTKNTAYVIFAFLLVCGFIAYAARHVETKTTSPPQASTGLVKKILGSGSFFRWWLAALLVLMAVLSEPMNTTTKNPRDQDLLLQFNVAWAIVATLLLGTFFSLFKRNSLSQFGGKLFIILVLLIPFFYFSSCSHFVGHGWG